MQVDPGAYWSADIKELQKGLESSEVGLTQPEALKRSAQFGANLLNPPKKNAPLILFLHQFKSSLVLILVFAAIISIVSNELLDASIVMVIIFASAFLGFIQEYNAGNAVEKLRKQTRLRSTVLRNGKPISIHSEEIVPGDVVILTAGSIIPADAIVFEADDFFVNQAVLTGETFPVEKKPGMVSAESSLAQRTNCVYMGTNVRSGMAKVLILTIGEQTEFGKIAERLTLKAPETEFERGIRRFGNLLTQVMMALVLVVFAINVILNKPPIDSLLFAVALAVGMAPELLPAIISITLSQGAQKMAKEGVIVRRLEAIENFGSMDVLCTDKTGTLTLGVVSLDGAFDWKGAPSPRLGLFAYLNASMQTGLPNPLDEAITQNKVDGAEQYTKTEEIPYDFNRKRLSIAVRPKIKPNGEVEPKNILITKGALEKILDVCVTIRDGDSPRQIKRSDLEAIQQRFIEWSDQGYRVLGLSTRLVAPMPEYPVETEADMCFEGFLLFFDPPKPDAAKAIEDLTRLGVDLKVITGDNHLVTRHVALATGLGIKGIITGAEMMRMDDEALRHTVNQANLFAEVDPNQKERIISALQKTGHVVGYMGDGINDAPALHLADVSISVDTAVDVAKDAADFVLLQQSLDVLRQGIQEGRRTFANTLKYVYTTTSANFGNMFSMAGLSWFLPFLPLLAKQILLNNFMSDFPAMTIAGDNVDPEMVEKPKRWDVASIRNFMIVFGLISSIFDYLTFGVLLLIVKSNEAQFQTGWFIESLLTELFILIVVRTSRPLFRSKPGGWLLSTTLSVAAVAIIIPYIPWVANIFGFEPLPTYVLLLLLLITTLYIIVNEIVKHFFFKRLSFETA